jgi:hypothetical protein
MDDRKVERERRRRVLGEGSASGAARVLVADDNPCVLEVCDVVGGGPGFGARDPWRDLLATKNLRYDVDLGADALEPCPPRYVLSATSAETSIEVPLDGSTLPCAAVAVVYRLGVGPLPLPDDALFHGFVLLDGAVVWREGDVRGLFREMRHLRPSSLDLSAPAQEVSPFDRHSVSEGYPMKKEERNRLRAIVKDFLSGGSR